MCVVQSVHPQIEWDFWYEKRHPQNQLNCQKYIQFQQDERRTDEKSLEYGGNGRKKCAVCMHSIRTHVHFFRCSWQITADGPNWKRNNSIKSFTLQNRCTATFSGTNDRKGSTYETAERERERKNNRKIVVFRNLFKERKK